jgi:two-component sensor histidine kinase
LLHRVRVQRQTQKHLEAIESLHAISTAIGAQISAGTALDALASAAQRLLRMDRAAIGMLDAADRTLHVVAAVGAVPPEFPKLFRLVDLPASSYCLETDTITYEGDLRRAARRYGPQAVRLFGAVSLILIPLRLENRPIGLLTLSSSRPRGFTDLDRRICELLGSQASVVLSNQQLYKQMRAALESSQRLLQQREALSAANAAIKAHDAIEDSLAQIVRLVPAALGTDLCGLTLLEGPNRESVLAAVSPPYEKHVGTRIESSPLSEEAFETRKPLIIPDARTDSRLHPAWRDAPFIRSILYIPMFRSDGQAMGILALARKQTGTFSQEQIELGQNFSALTALAVDNARLLEQTREDAATKSVLLRELNHRVKNNLTGIVALLELNRPPMPADVRHWLDRLTSRVRSMAGAHQLFTGRVERVSLDSLVPSVLAACMVNKAPGVRVQTELQVAELTLDPEQAVALAMVLNELCYNAMIHGLRDGGTLTIRARDGTQSEGSSQHRVVIDVADDGSGCCDAAGASSESCAPAALVGASNRGTGHGLELVEGLVTRELRGTFALRPGPGGGTVATVEFPLAGAEQ